MHDELFEKLDIVARYRAGPDVEARERFLRQASAEGHSRSTLKRIAWVLLFVADPSHSRYRDRSSRLRISDGFNKCFWSGPDAPGGVSYRPGGGGGIVALKHGRSAWRS